jgi:hypothetical protein
LLVIALSSATTTAYCLLEYPALKAAGLDPSLPIAWALLLLLIAAPLLWLGALVVPAIEWIDVLCAHAAFFTVAVVIDEFVASPGHSSPGEALADAFASVIWLFILLVPGADLLVAIVTRVRVKKVSPEKITLSMYVGLAAALLGGLLVWSALLAPRVIVAAEFAAGDRPYCIDLEKGPASSRASLRGLSIRATNERGWTWRFHALLVIGDAADRNYQNWSYRTGRFEPVSEHAREALHLDKIARCRPTPHFARDWL